MDDLLTRLIADWLVVPIALLGAYAILRLPVKHRYKMIARGVIAGLTALLFAKIASLLYQGERPFVEMGVEPGAAFLPNPGFPSDHALLVFTIVFVVWASTKKKALSLALLLMAVLVGTGRIIALVHTPIDVLGGVACAFLAVALIFGKRLFSLKFIP